MAINSLASKGMPGLVSGMDTQSMVDKMLKGTQSKIDMKKQQKAVLAYKQEMYRNLATQIKTFQQTFFSFGKPESNILSNSFFQSMNATTDSKFFTAKASSGASVGSMKINQIKKLATSHKEVAATNATGKLEGSFSSEAMKKITDKITDATKSNVTITLGSGENATEVKIAMKDLLGKSTSDSVDIINAALKSAGADTTADFIDGRVTLTSKSGQEVAIVGGENIVGVVSGVANADGAVGFILDTKSIMPSINIAVDGISKKITFNPLEMNSGETEKDSVIRQLNSGIKTAFGKGVSLDADPVTGAIKLNVANSTSTVSITGDQESLNVIGMKNNLSNKLALGTSIKDVNFATTISGNMQKFSINGVDFSFSSGTSMSNIMAQVNSSSAGVKITYDNTRDRFMIESTTSGEKTNGANGTPFEFKQTEGNVLTAMFGASSSDTFSSQVLSVKEMDTSQTFKTAGFKFTAKDFAISLTKDDKTESFSFTGLTESTDPAQVVSELNAKIAESDAMKNEDGSVKAEFKLKDNGDGTQTIELISKDPAVKAAVVGEGLSELGYSAKVTGESTMKELGFGNFTYQAGGKDININAEMTLEDFLKTLEANGVDSAKLETLGATPFIRLAGVSIPMVFPEPPASKLFGGQITPGTGTIDATSFSKQSADGYVQGTNAIVVVDGVEIERSTNTFTEKGITITLKDVTDVEQTVNVSQNTDQIFDTVKKFVEEYNKLTNDINKMLDSDTTYRNYSPLTDEQKKEMSDKEIEIWEEKAKGGLMRNDSVMQTIKNDLRSTLYTKPDASGYALFDLGITTDYFGVKDNLVIADEAALKKKISENPDAVRRLFTDTEKGLATLVDKAMTKASGSTGSLTSIAGGASAVDTSSTIYRQMKQIDDSLDRLETTYEKQYQRYWSQFNAMEQQLAKMNQQSSWLSQQLGG